MKTAYSFQLNLHGHRLSVTTSTKEDLTKRDVEESDHAQEKVWKNILFCI